MSSQLIGTLYSRVSFNLLTRAEPFPFRLAIDDSSRSFYSVPSLDKVTSLHLDVPYNSVPADYPDKMTYPALHLPNLLHLTLRCQAFYGPSAKRHYAPFLSFVRPLLPVLNPETLTIVRLPNRTELKWVKEDVPNEIWEAIHPNWTRLNAVRFVDCSCFTKEADEGFAFLSSSPLTPISFSWEFTASAGGYAAVSAEEEEYEERSALEALEDAGVFEHPSVREVGIRLVVGGVEGDVVAVRKDLEGLDEEFRSLVHVHA
jgi:hypothetical protein